jgi:hypothetical protein
MSEQSARVHRLPERVWTAATIVGKRRRRIRYTPTGFPAGVDPSRYGPGCNRLRTCSTMLQERCSLPLFLRNRAAFGNEIDWLGIPLVCTTAQIGAFFAVSTPCASVAYRVKILCLESNQLTSRPKRAIDGA